MHSTMASNLMSVSLTRNEVGFCSAPVFYMSSAMFLRKSSIF